MKSAGRKVGLMSYMSSIVAFCMLSVVLSACGSASAKTSSIKHSSRELTVEVLSTAPLTTLDPELPGTGITDQPLYQTFMSTLFNIGSNGTITPGLAQSIVYSKNGLSATLTLKPGQKFSDGTPVNASAVAYNINADRNPKIGCTCLTAMEPITSAKAASTYKVLMTLSHPYRVLDQVFSATMAGYMISPTALKKMGSSFDVDPIGAGPYKIVTFNSSELLVRTWAGYAGPAPYYDEIKFIFTASANSAYDALTSGEAQMFIGSGALTPSTGKQAERDSSLQVIDPKPVGTYEVEINTYRAPFNNPKAREALFYATDQATIVKDVLLGYGYFDESLIADGTIPSLPEGEKLSGFPSYNLAKAKSLVKQVGGISFTMEPLTTTPFWITLLEALQKEWAAAGIHVTIDTSEGTAQIITDLEKGTYQAIVSRSAMYELGYLTATDLYLCGGLNQGFCSKGVVADVNAAGESATLSGELRYLEAANDQAIAKEFAYLPIATVPELTIADKDLKGIGDEYYIDTPAIHP